jgi:hypothetical protein
MGFDPDEECDAPGCPSSPINSPPARAGLLAPDPAFQKLDTAELLAMAPCPAESVLRRGRATMELGRLAAGDPALQTEVAALISDPANKRLITTVPVSQLGAAGLVADLREHPLRRL